jgi:hypothetical protein
VTAKQAIVTLLEGADIILFFLALGITKCLNQWKQKKIIFREEYERNVQD